MVGSVRRRWLFGAALLLFCAFGAGLADEFIHTDDGCPFEVHCLACQRLLASVGIGTPALLARPAIDVVGRVTSVDPEGHRDADAPARASRAPPLA
jgi:hypothetical protein